MKRAIREINVGSDFDFVIRSKGEEGFPCYDFEGEIWPEKIRELREIYDYDWDRLIEIGKRSGLHPYLFSRKGAYLTNCVENNGGIQVVVDNHRLPAGRLLLVLKRYLPNPLYPDRNRKTVSVYPLDIELVEGNGDTDFGTPEIDVTIPYVYLSAYVLARAQGYEGTEEDFNRALMSVGEIGGIAEEAKKALQEWEESKKDYITGERLKEATKEYIDGANLNEEELKIELTHGQKVVAHIDAQGFYAGGLEHVDLVEKGEASKGVALVFTFTKESRKEPIEVPMDKILNGVIEFEDYTEEEIREAIGEDLIEGI